MIKKFCLLFLSFSLMITGFSGFFNPYRAEAAADSAEIPFYWDEFSPDPSRTNLKAPIYTPAGKTVQRWEVTLNGRKLDGQPGTYNESTDEITFSLIFGDAIKVYGRKDTNPGHHIWRNTPGTLWDTEGAHTGRFQFRGNCGGQSNDSAPSNCPGLFPNTAYNMTSGSNAPMPDSLRYPNGNAVTAAYEIEPPAEFYTDENMDPSASKVQLSKIKPDSIKIYKGTGLDYGVDFITSNPSSYDNQFLVPGKGFMKVGKPLTSSYNTNGSDYVIVGGGAGNTQGRNYLMSARTYWGGLTYSYSGKVKVFYSSEPNPVLVGKHRVSDPDYGRTAGEETQDGRTYMVNPGNKLPIALDDRTTGAGSDMLHILYHKYPNGSTTQEYQKKVAFKDLPSDLTIGKHEFWLTIVTPEGKEFKSNIVKITVAEGGGKPLPMPVITHKDGDSRFVSSTTGSVGQDFKLSGISSYDTKKPPRTIIRYIWYIKTSSGSWSNAQKYTSSTPAFAKETQDSYFKSAGTYNVRLYVQVDDGGPYPVDPLTGNVAEITVTVNPASSQYPTPNLASSSHTVLTSSGGGPYIEVLKDASFNVNGSGSTSPNGAIVKYIYNSRKVDGTPAENAWSAASEQASAVFDKSVYRAGGVYEVRLAVIDAANKDSRNNPDAESRYAYMRIIVGAKPGHPPEIDGIVNGIAYVGTPTALIDKSTDKDHTIYLKSGLADSDLYRIYWSILDPKYESIFGPYAHYVALEPTKKIDFMYGDELGNPTGGSPVNGKILYWRNLYPWHLQVDLPPSAVEDFLTYQYYVDDTGNVKEKAYEFDVATANKQEFTLTESPDRKAYITFNKTGTYTIMQRILDEENNTKTKLYTIQVFENKPPIAEFDTERNAGRIKPYKIFDYSSDPDDGIEWYTWTVTHNGVTSKVKINKDTNAKTNSLQPGTKADLSGLLAGDGQIVYQELGTYDISLEVVDHGGKSASYGPLTVTVSNTPPENKIETAPVIYVGELLPATLTATDYDGTIAAESVTMNGVSLTAAEITELKSGQKYFTEEGTYNYVYNVTDNDGAPNKVPATSTTVVKKQVPTGIWVIDQSQSTNKENRRIVVDASLSEILSEASNKYPIDWAATEWDVQPVSGVTAAQIKTKPLGGKQLGITVKGVGTIKVKVRVKNSQVKNMPETGFYSDWYEQTVDVYPDQPPIADFEIGNPIAFRNPANGNNMGILLKFTGGSLDGDIISNVTWYVRKDDNDNKTFDEPWTQFATGTDAVFTTNRVGLYQFRITIAEEFGQAYYPEHVTAADRRTANSDAKIPDNYYIESRDLKVTVAMIDNVAPKLKYESTVDPTANILIMIDEGQWAAWTTKEGNNMDQIDYLIQKLNINELLTDITVKSYNPNVPEQRRGN